MSRPAAGLALCLALALPACERPVERGDVVARIRALERPNVVLLVVDTLRADRLSPYGEKRRPTPELARWGERGVVFEHVLSQSSWTKVSMASMMTSLWPHTHGVAKTNDGLADGAFTLAEAFHDAGYRTYGVQSNGWLEQTFGFHQGFDRYMFPHGGGWQGFKPMIWPHADNVYLEAERLIEAHDPDEPFFLYLHFMDVHEYAAPPEFKRYGTDSEGAYIASIAWVDEVVERLRKKLDDEGLLANSILALGSDHGEAFGENGKHGHARNVLTAVLHVPFLLRLPFPVEPIRIAAQVRNVDIAPTLLDLAGIAIPDSFEGRSLLPLLSGGKDAAPDDRTAYASLTALLYRDAKLQESVTDGVWTLARDLPMPPEEGNGDGAAGAAGSGTPHEYLYDRSVDPAEDVNLIDIEPAQAERMRELLALHLERKAAEGAVESDVRIDPALAQKLRALGYMR